MVTRKRSQHRYYSARPSTHMIPVASAPACVDDVDHAVTFVSKKQSKKKMSQSVKAKYLSPMRNTLNSSLVLLICFTCEFVNTFTPEFSATSFKHLITS